MSRKPPATRADYRVFYPVQTRWMDNDIYGHINNVTYLAYFDTVVALWQIDNGIPVAQDGGMRFLVVESGATYHAEARFPEKLEAGIRVGHLGTSSMRFEVGIFREGQDNACVEGFFTHVAVNDETRPTPLPAEVRARIEQILV